MGQEIGKTRFAGEDYERFREQLATETQLLRSWFQEGRFDSDERVAGFELEGCLVDEQGQPAPQNERFIDQCDPDWVTPELARFNVELNGAPQRFEGNVLSRLERELKRGWGVCESVGEAWDVGLLSIGILPTLKQGMLHAGNMSSLKRYAALNDQLLKSRDQRPIEFEIEGREKLHIVHPNVMLESAATSFQIHLQVPFREATEVYNACIAVSPLMVAVAANSPYLFGRDLWDETRIPLFEGAVNFENPDGHRRPSVPRVTFGSGYARHSLLECFEENLESYGVLLPIDLSGEAERLPHLRLHNGTIWRWNRPLLGFGRDAVPHLRIEHRVCAAGTSAVDMVADVALLAGLTACLVNRPEPVNTLMPFQQVRADFYAAARAGLRSEVGWIDGRRGTVAALVLAWLPRVFDELVALGSDREEAAYYLEVIRERVERGMNGATWQRRWCEHYGLDMSGLTRAYHANQHRGEPVARWSW